MKGDYISRQAAIVEVCKGCNIEFSDEPCEPSECKISERIIDIPAAKVIPIKDAIEIASSMFPFVPRTVVEFAFNRKKREGEKS